MICCPHYTVCPGSSDPSYIVSYYTEWVTTSWTYGTEGVGSNPRHMRTMEARPSVYIYRNCDVCMYNIL